MANTRSYNYYQIPNKTLGEFNIDTDKIYTQTIISGNCDANFTEAARISSNIVASTEEIGGIKLYQIDNSDDTSNSKNPNGVITDEKQRYAVQLDSDDNRAFVYVPWENTQTIVNNTTNYLKLISSDTSANITQYKIDLSIVPATLLCGCDLDLILSSNQYGTFQKISTAITKPLCNEITTLNDNILSIISNHIDENYTEFNSVELSISNISNDISNYYYKRIETSSKTEIANAITELNNNFINTKNSLSNTISTGYYQKDQVYQKSDTYNRTETSSNIELKQEFDTKQDNLNVKTVINSQNTNLTDKDVATVSAIIDFVNSSIEKNGATFQGSFQSWTDVPDDKNSTEYTSVPDKNDYIYVNIGPSDYLIDNTQNTFLDQGVWKFVIASSSWNSQLNRKNWKPEYKISETLFTDAQTKAINSGIAAYKVDNYDDLLVNYKKLSAEIAKLSVGLEKLSYGSTNLSNIIGSGKKDKLAMFSSNNEITSISFTPKVEIWNFELYDGSVIKKKIIVQDV